MVKSRGDTMRDRNIAELASPLGIELSVLVEIGPPMMAVQLGACKGTGLS